MEYTKKIAARVIRPLVKWTGGKYEEFSKFSAYIPGFDRYFEPFFGGGGVFFALQPSESSFINDRSKDLIAFYHALLRSGFQKEMRDLVAAWEALKLLSEDFSAYILDKFAGFLVGDIDQSSLFAAIDFYFSRLGISLWQPVCAFSAVEKDVLLAVVQESAKDKFKRIKRIATREKRLFDTHELNDHVETAVRSGFYQHMRYLMNEGRFAESKPDTHIALWYFVREFCYASMFRFNAQGKFNIPYGGIAYNKKNLRAKTEALFADQVKDIFRRCQIFNLDFEEFLNVTKPSESDFIFLDPPYDSEFSEYDQNAFTRADQVRLRDCLHAQSAKWMLVIKETPFIRELYEQINANFVDFDKTYQYNVRGRNNRATTHLIITNYTI